MRTMLLIVTLFTALSSGSVTADPERRSPGRDSTMRYAQAERQRITADQAAAIARRATNGRVLDVSIGNGGRVYLVRVLLDNGRVRTVRIDAQTGSMR